ncbi:MAG: hypothetical protein O3C43_04950 [Verrucomicrobia bacterium]|nr:hypothetical protein [Verrucomicrobiota bacterium]MDA1065831.1 hypothetical protein [Verrucomicrobiota bacterium]
MIKKLITILSAFLALVMLVLFISNPLTGLGESEQLQFFGRFHPVVLHLPIGFFIVLGVLEFGSMIPGVSKLKDSTPLVLFLSIIATLLAISTGLILAYGSGSSEALVVYHMRVSLLLGIFSLGLGLLKLNGNKIASVLCYKVVLIATLGLLFVSSHNGGSITHGEDYLTKFMPNEIRPLFGLELEEEVVVMSVEDLIVYRDVVHQIFEQNCNSCHNPNKRKGEFNMETFEGLMKGGEMGYSIAAGDLEDSELYFRITLPHDDDDFMPSDGKPPLSDLEVELIGWWIEEGADPNLSVAEYGDIPAPIYNYFQSVFDSIVSKEELEARENQRQALYAELAEIQNKSGIILTPIEPNASRFSVDTFAIQKTFDDAALETLIPYAEKIIEADFSNTKLTDLSLSTLVKFKNLESLNLSKTGIEGQQIGKLAQLEKLKSLNLYATKLTSTSVGELSKLAQLKHLYLFQTDLYEESIIAELKEALPECNFVLN